MAKFIALLICILVLYSITGTGCSSGTQEPAESSAQAEIANPVEECKSLDEAEEIAGFGISVPEGVEDSQECIISVINKELIEIQYTDADGNEICLRKAAGSEDISGDFSDYPEENTTQIGGNTVLLKGSDGNIMNATWTDGDYSYSVTCSGLSEDQITGILSALS